MLWTGCIGICGGNSTHFGTAYITNHSINIWMGLLVPELDSNHHQWLPLRWIWTLEWTHLLGLRLHLEYALELFQVHLFSHKSEIAFLSFSSSTFLYNVGYESCIAPLWRRGVAELIDTLLVGLLLRFYLPDVDYRYKQVSIILNCTLSSVIYLGFT